MNSAYTSQQEAIRSGLYNFLGSLYTSSYFDAKDIKAKESVIALVLEELCKMCQKENKEIDLSCARPILKSSLWVLQQREIELKQELDKLNVPSKEIEKMVEPSKSLINDLNKYINKI